MYLIWRACERLNLTPKGLKKDFESNANWIIAHVLTYEQIREIEETEDNYGSKIKS
jgi:hypothetical protein